MGNSDAIWESSDRVWFEANLGQTIRIRNGYGGEFDGGQLEAFAQFCVRYAGYTDSEIVGIGTYTIVVRVDGATRLRLPYWRSEFANGDMDRIPIEAELREGGKTTSLSGFLSKLDGAAEAAGLVTEKYLEDMMPEFVMTDISYGGDGGPDEKGLAAMLACFEMTCDESRLRDSFTVRAAMAADHERHASLFQDYDRYKFPAVLIVQPFPGFFFRMPFPNSPMKDSDSYGFTVTAKAGQGTLGDYLKQVRESFLFAVKSM